MTRSGHLTLRIAAAAVIAVEALLPRAGFGSQDVGKTVEPATLVPPAPPAPPAPIAVR